MTIYLVIGPDGEGYDKIWFIGGNYQLCQDFIQHCDINNYDNVYIIERTLTTQTGFEF